MRVLLVLNDPPYGTERSYNGLRLGGALAKRDDTELRVFLLGDAVGAAVAGQQLPDGYYHLDRMVRNILHRGGGSAAAAAVWMCARWRRTGSSRERAVRASTS